MKRKRSPVDLITLVVLCVLGIVMGRIQTVRRSEGKTDWVSAASRTILMPISTPAGNLASSTSYFVQGIFSAKRMAIEHQDLVAMAGVAALYQGRIDDLEHQIDDLRQLDQLAPAPGKTRIFADVIGFSPYENRLTLNVGQNQGITPGAPVQAAQGLVGTVQTVEANRCQALLLTSTSLTVGALDISRNPPPAGLLRGENSSTLSVLFQNPKAPVEIGDEIATSGFSEHIPRGIPIGKVISVITDEEFGIRRATVDPAVSPGQLRVVQVLR